MTIFDLGPRFISEYKGKPLVIVAVGAGAYLNLLTLFPGSSKVVDEIHNPYSFSAMEHWLGVDNYSEMSAVSHEMVKAMYKRALQRPELNQFNYIVITGALATNRWRRGKEHAYVVIDDTEYYVEFDKLPEEAYKSFTPDMVAGWRNKQDCDLTEWVLNILLGISTPTVGSLIHVVHKNSVFGSASSAH